jgi:hypothetical protein
MVTDGGKQHVPEEARIFAELPHGETEAPPIEITFRFD